LLDPPLTHSLKTIKKLYPNLKLRLKPNEAAGKGLPIENGLYGGWVLPQMMSHYENYIYMCEFSVRPVGSRNAQREELIKIYKED
jgi:hypothetical protein